jgi:hypothetical protein
VKLLRQLVAWWRGDATPADRAEATRVAEQVQATRAEAAREAQTTRTQGF